MIIVKYDAETDDYTVECWEASTKHPDSFNRMSRDIEEGKFILNEFIAKKYQVYQWLLYVASQKTFPFHAVEMVDYANEHWNLWDK